eukprot:1625457-Prymnesium_polylepis.1
MGEKILETARLGDMTVDKQSVMLMQARRRVAARAPQSAALRRSRLWTQGRVGSSRRKREPPAHAWPS